LYCIALYYEVRESKEAFLKVKNYTKDYLSYSTSTVTISLEIDDLTFVRDWSETP